MELKHQQSLDGDLVLDLLIVPYGIETIQLLPDL